MNFRNGDNSRKKAEKNRFPKLRRLLRLDRPEICITRRIHTSQALIQAGAATAALMVIFVLIMHREFFSPGNVRIITGHRLFALSLILSAVTGLTIMFKVEVPVKVHRAFSVIYYLLAPFFALAMSECVNKIFIYKFSPQTFILNYLVFLLLYSAAGVITGRFKKAIFVMTPLIWAFSIAASYLLQFRGTPLQPVDFLTIKTGMEVASGYDYTPQAYMILGTYMFLEIMVIAAKIPSVRVRPRHRMIFRGISLLLILAVLIPFYTTDIAAKNGIKPDFWNQARGYSRKGTVYNFMLNTRYLIVETPEGYKASEVDDIMKSFIEKHPDDPGIFERAQLIQAQEAEKAEEEAALKEASGTDSANSDAAGKKAAQEDTRRGHRAENTDEDEGPVVNRDGSVNMDGEDEPNTIMTELTAHVPLAVEETSKTNQPRTSAKLRKGQTPNVIVIMNETLSDLHVLGDFSTNKDYMPFIRNLTANTVKGNLYLPVNGAGTSNSEFEVLTGDSMGLLPAGSNAYQLYVERVTPSLAHTLKDQNYYSWAYHTYYKAGWRRSQVYPLMGFDRYTAMEDMFGAQLVNSYKEGTTSLMEFENQLREMYPDDDKIILRRFISDSFDYKQLIKMYEERNRDKRLFLFNVTMQNHGGYAQSYLNLNEQIFTTSTMDYYPQTNRFLSLIYESDCAFRELVDYFSSVKDPTMIVMFGDHQPSIETKFISEIMGKSLNSLTVEETQRRYVTPFLIWTNYKSESGYVEKMSANYLSTMILQRAGLKTTEYNDYLSALYSELPVIDTTGYISADGIYYTYDDKSKYSGMLSDYKKIIYNHLFDTPNRTEDLFRVREDGSD